MPTNLIPPHTCEPCNSGAKGDSIRPNRPQTADCQWLSRLPEGTMAENSGDTGDFGAFLDAHLAGLRTEFEPGEKLTGVVTGVDRSSVFVDIHAKSEGILDRSELLDKEGNLTVEVGDSIEAFFISIRDDEIRLGLKMSADAFDDSLQDARESGMPVEGRVEEERKGGYSVKVGTRTAFCPYSQMGMFRREASEYIGQRFLFAIAEYSEGGRNIVLSRRRLLERQRADQLERLKAEVSVGDVLDGTVRRAMPFGVFVELAGGVEGLVPLRELSWGHVAEPGDFLSEGAEVRVAVIDVDWEAEKITLSLREAGGDPWQKVEASYHQGGRYEGTVRKIMPFGAFVELEPGIEGLVHVSKLGAAHVNHPSEVLNEGDSVEVSVDTIDTERRRLSLSMDDTIGRGIGADDILAGAEVIAVGAEIEGVVDAVRDFGVFVKLPTGRTGLLHVSQIELKGSTNQRRAMYDMFPPNSQVKVVVKAIDGNRISLTLRETLEREAESADVKDYSDQDGSGLGSLDGLFGGLKL